LEELRGEKKNENTLNSSEERKRQIGLHLRKTPSFNSSFRGGEDFLKKSERSNTPKVAFVGRNAEVPIFRISETKKGQDAVASIGGPVV